MEPESIIIPCHRCGAKNRLPMSRLKDRPVCGKCRAPLPFFHSKHPHLAFF